MSAPFGSVLDFLSSQSDRHRPPVVAPSFFAVWRQQRQLRRSAASYVLSLLTEPGPEDVSWLSDVATRGDADRARWELRYARRAAGLLSAARDALDDRTASAVAHEIGESWAKDRNIAAEMRHAAEQQFNARLRALGQAMAARSSPEPTSTRLGRALLTAAGARNPSAADTDRAGGIVSEYLEQANEALRRVFGTAALPENLPPSAVQAGGPAATPRR
jgi:hypothetical protein